MLLQLLGFFGGIHLAILVAYVCQRHPNASMNLLVSIFFDCFSHWSWPKPVNLLDQSRPSRRPDSRSLMPIMMPCRPFDWCNSNITKSTFNKIENEFQRGYIITRVCFLIILYASNELHFCFSSSILLIFYFMYFFKAVITYCFILIRASFKL